MVRTKAPPQRLSSPARLARAAISSPARPMSLILETELARMMPTGGKKRKLRKIKSAKSKASLKIKGLRKKSRRSRK